MDQQKPESKKPAAANNKAGSKEVDDFFETFMASVRNGNLEEIISFYSPEVTVFDMMPPLRFHGTEIFKQVALKESFTDVFNFPIEIEMKEHDISLIGDTVISHGIMHMSGQFKAGKKMEAHLRNTTVLKKIDGRWLIVHEHSSAPSDTTGKVLLNLVPDDAADGFGVH